VGKIIKIGFEHRAKHIYKMRVNGPLAIPVLRYSFGIINLLQKLDRKNKEDANHSWTASPHGRH